MFTIKAKLKQLNETEQSKVLHYMCNGTCCDKMTIAVDIKVVYMSSSFCSWLLDHVIYLKLREK